MSERPLLELFLLMAGLSLLSFGGVNAVMPEAQRQIVDQGHWLDPRQFSELFAIAQAAPGPNVIFYSALGLSLKGAAGMAAATAGILGPSSVLSLTIGRLCRSVHYVRWTRPSKAAMAPLASGLMMSGGWVLLRQEQSHLAFLVAGSAAAYGLFCDRSPLWAIIFGAGFFILAQNWI